MYRALLLSLTLTGCSTIINGSNARLTIDSVPTHAELFIDEHHVGMTPFTGEVPHGAHAIRVEKEGYKPTPASVTASFSGWSLVGVALILPFVIDVVTGAVTSVDQTKLTVVLRSADEAE